MKIIFKLYTADLFKDALYFKKKHRLAYEALISGYVAIDKIKNVRSPFSVKNTKRYSI
jgi:hypothetical protein